MKEIRQIVEAYGQIDFTKNSAALATVARVEGSSYRRTGARMLVLDNGVYLGGISGGCLEGDALRRARKALAARRPSVVTYDTTREDHDQIGVGLGCNGIIDVLFTPLDPADPANPVALLRERAYDRRLALLATLTGVDTRSEALGRTCLYESPDQWRRDFPLPDLADAVLTDVLHGLESGQTRTRLYPATDGGEVQICLEVLTPATQLVLYGANYDIYPLARIGRELGWDVVVVANPLKVDKSLAGLGARVLHPNGAEQPDLDSHTAIVLMAHDYKTDFRNLQRLLASPVRYLGLLGPRKRYLKMLDELCEAGLTAPETVRDQVYAPAGLDIGALSPEEIALSIAAEICACFNRRTGASLRLRKTAIHSG